MPDLTLRIDDLTGEQSRALVRMHLAQMVANSPSYSMNAVDLSALERADVTVISAWSGEAIAGIGALRVLNGQLGELKSMRTHPDFIRQGVASAVLERIIAETRGRGLTRLALECGTGGPFENAIAFYKRHGFIPCAPFGGYEDTDFNCFLDREL